MKAEYINPFIEALITTFDTMLSCEVTRGKLSLKENSCAEYLVSGIIGLSGRAVGTVVLSFSENVAIQAASAMLMFEATEITEDVLDAVGELTNMVAGAAKAKLEEYKLMVSLPNVVTGLDHEVHFPSNVTPISVAFDTQWGPLSLEVGLAEVSAPVSA